MSKKTTTTRGANAADVKAIHARLKQVIRDEVEKLPQLLAELTPQERVNAILELLPYCAPKLEKVNADFGEGNAWDENFGE